MKQSWPIFRKVFKPRSAVTVEYRQKIVVKTIRLERELNPEPPNYESARLRF